MEIPSREQFVSAITDKLTQQQATLTPAFAASAAGIFKTRYCLLDNLLPEAYAKLIYAKFPSISKLRQLTSFRERKSTSKNFHAFHSIILDISMAFQHIKVIKAINQITGIKDQIADPTFYAGGVSAMRRGDFLNPHIDNSHDASQHYYRTLNLLYYITPDWQMDFGGNLELWDSAVKQKITLASHFNRLILMETHPHSWHGVSPVKSNHIRCCISNYYFSAISPTGSPYFHVTSFSARPEQRIRRVISSFDNLARNQIRKFKRAGFGKKDIFEKEI